MGLLDTTYSDTKSKELRRRKPSASQADVRKMEGLIAGKSVMGLLGNAPEWVPEYEREPGLEAPMLSPDDLLGSGVGKLALSALAPLGLMTLKGGGKAGSNAAMKNQLGAIAWHGSPHKFDKFSLEKIGTGEGAQAYGHGLYLAEAPEVAKEYQRKLAKGNKALTANDKMEMIDVGGRNFADYRTEVDTSFLEKAKEGHEAFAKYAKDRSERWRQLSVDKDYPFKEYATAMDERYKALLSDLETNRVSYNGAGQLYKTDIPDEALAKFLDWDKPLSQQAPEVQSAIGGLEAKGTGFTYKDIVDALKAAPHLNDPKDHAWAHPSGQEIYNSLGDSMMVGNRAIGQAEATQKLKELGIPGIRYLDGGSRSSGQGSSNYVIFDPEMIRILERNGQATGAQPWSPGEYGLLK